MKLVILSPPNDYPDEHQVVCTILQQSSATFHLRKPGQTDRQIADYLKRVPVDLHPRIMVHGHPCLLEKFALKGIHFTERQRRRTPQTMRQLRLAWPECLISSAFHRLADIPEHDGCLDYIFLSPIFDSISKKGYRAAFACEDLKRWIAQTGHTVVALGGVDRRRVADAAALGFTRVAVLGAVWASAWPARAARQLSAICRRIEP